MKNITFLILFLTVTLTGYAQKIKLIEGNLAPLKGQTSIRTEFTYEPMAVGKYADEKEYIAQKKSDLNKKEAGRGDEWEKKWKADRKDRFEPQFRELFAKHSGLSTVDDNAPYTLVFKTTKTEPGWNVGVTRAPAFIDAEAWIVESKNPSSVVAKIQLTKAPGRDAWGMDYETGMRLQEAYAKAGKSLGGFIKGKTKK
jgi:hypothetical protein